MYPHNLSNKSGLPAIIVSNLTNSKYISNLTNSKAGNTGMYLFKLSENSRALADLKLCINVSNPDKNPLTIVLNGSGSEIYKKKLAELYITINKKAFL